MMYRKIANSLRLDSGVGGQLLEVELDAIWSGHTMKQANFQVVPRQKSSTNAKVGLKLKHGPDGKAFTDHSTPITSTQLTGTTTLLDGDSSSTKMLGEVLLPVMTIEGMGVAEWAQVDVYMVAKPF